MAASVDRLSLLDRLPPEERARSLPTGSRDHLLVDLGDELEALAAIDLASAERAVGWLLPLADAVGDPSSRARVRRAAALTLTYAGRPDDALSLCVEGNEIAGAGRNVVEASRATLASVHPLAMLGRIDEAIAAAQGARAALAQSGRLDLAARADFNLGAIYAMLERIPEAVAAFDRARPGLYADPSSLARMESNAGVVLIGLGRFDEAAAALERAMLAFQRAGQAVSAASARSNLAHLLMRRGRLAEAVALYEQVDDELRSASASSGQRALVQAEQAAAFGEVGLAAESAELASRAIAGLDDAGMALDAAMAHLTLAAAQSGLGNLAVAVTSALEAGERLSAIGNEPAAARADTVAARYLVSSSPEGARAVLRRRVDARVGHPLDELDATLVAADIALACSEVDSAAAEVATAQAAARDLAYLPGKAEVLHLAGRLNQARGERALWPLRGAVAAAERLRSAFRASAFQSAVQTRYLGPYLDLVREAVLRGEPAEAFWVSELCKQRQLARTLGPTVELELAADEERGSTNPQRRHLTEQLSWRYAAVAQAGLSGLGVDPDDLARIAALERELTTIDRRSDAGRLTAHGFVDGDTPRHLHLPPGSVGLSFIVLSDAIVALLVRPDGDIESVVTPMDCTYLERLLGGFSFQLARALNLPDRSDDPRLVAGFQRGSAALYDLILRPVAPLIEDGAHLVISPHQDLHALPFSALWDGSAYAGERWTLSTLPNLSLTTRYVEPSKRSGVPLIVGVWDEQAPSIAAEVAAVGAELPGATTLVEAEATAAAVSVAAGVASDLHIACHGHFSAAAPRSAGLRLADGWLSVGVIQRLPLQGAHVTLSGCDTGVATHSKLDDAVGLPAALLGAGVESMLVSHWPAHDVASTLLMTEWYRRRRGGIAPAQALADAQRTTRSQYPHPALWSAFYVGGLA